MRWLVTGAHGMLGQDLVTRLGSGGHTVTAVDREAVDITEPAAVLEAVRGHDVVANCAAWTAVDDAETREGDAFRINAVGAASVARAAAAAGARVVHVSTDYVFDGDVGGPFDEHAPVAPRTAYGRTKAAGEWAVRAEAADHLVVRTAWLYGARGACFPRTIARVARERGGLDVVDDQHGQPTWTVDLADLLVRLVEQDAPAGTYHGTSSGHTSWWGFARAVVEAAGMDPEIVRPTTSEAFARPAPRPAWSVLGHDALRAAGVEPIGDWADRWRTAAEEVLGS
ncbi:dTDP-4-dehydrorhamnose reductase [Cellulomonas carbonis]|uniref:dTDP-4-dehydrorhamnose reductase n=1 Tax=Cellulomonas carbonis T26 TaxID=947969 RepID=A0A0A0BM41_9CELL|nr:dTDP-4-dehydrorhamnose reductase [Cellulomonas carbonis]KGM09036.1 dTDP-4-dehydrorhamnose reductase [Cellulomonas carbonis T26]GGC11341.1 NAD(P)-dependent oxidoreductase [Cellulomonas carbonis]